MRKYETDQSWQTLQNTWLVHLKTDRHEKQKKTKKLSQTKGDQWDTQIKTVLYPGLDPGKKENINEKKLVKSGV